MTVIQSDRAPVRLENGNWEVTDGFLQERFELERGLRWHLEQCRERERERTPQQSMIRPTRAAIGHQPVSPEVP